MAEFLIKLFSKVLGRYPGAGDLGLYRMTSTIYGIAMLVAIGIPAAMIKNLSFCGALPHDPASPVRAYKKALPKKQYSLYTTKYVAEFKDDRTKFNQIVSSGIITSLFLAISGLISFIACISLCFMGHG